ncbi:MAG: hypothetical protein K9G64_05965 [Bacteroidia bacterium]|jgi:hypothetical protein|nr:hypothetical protein [Bacteroidia bacterium]
MKFHDKLLLLFTLLTMVFISSCHRRYWYRSFVWSNSKNDIPVNISITNESPKAISTEFQKIILATCEKQLLKKGYKVTDKKVAFQFNLNLKVESYSVSGLAHIGGEKTSLIPYFNKDVQALLFECNLTQNKKDLKWKVWENQNDLYFFSIQKRDLRRSKSMVRYLIRSAK